jgi:hypothetical protein
MQTTLHFLDAVKARHELPSDYALAPLLGITRSEVSRLRNRKNYLGDSTAIKVAELLEIDSGIVIAAVHAERAKSDAERTAWASIFEKLGGLAALVLIGIGGLTAAPPAEASTGLQAQGNWHYVNRRRNSKRHKPYTFAGLLPLERFFLLKHT